MLHIYVRHTHCQQAFTGDVPPFTEAHAPRQQKLRSLSRGAGEVIGWVIVSFPHDT